MTRTEEKARFIAALLACYPDKSPETLASVATSLYRASATLSRLYEKTCSVEMSERQAAKHEAHETRIEENVKRACASLGLPVEIDGDPRNAQVKVKLPQGKGNGYEPGIWYI